MRKTALTFELPGPLSPEQFIAQLAEHLNIQMTERYFAVKSFYDSFDWRLYHAGMFCEFNQSEQRAQLSLQNIAHPQVLMSMEVADVPRFASDFTRHDFREQLELVLEMRALLKVATLDYQHTQLNVLNSDQKTVLRLGLDCFTQLPARVSVQLIKGYDKSVLPVIHLLQTALKLIPVTPALLTGVLKSQGKTVGSYSSKLAIRLAPDMQADIACKYIYSHLLKAIQLNQQGCIEQVDSEFLHDFRVAVRRTRAGFSQLKHVLPPTTLHYFADFFSWLSQITGPVRDIDVYLLNFQDFKHSLPISIREDLNPLRDYLRVKQDVAYQQLAEQLQSSRYVATLAEWQAYLHEPALKKPLEAFAKIPIKQLADRRIWKVYKNLLKEAKGIDKDASANALHHLRKTAKKLRYLMEFFQQLYPEMEIKNLLRSLKALQEVLGDFQDNAVQEQTLKQFSIELKDQGVSAATFLAIGVLVQALDKRKHTARQAFTLRFEQFKQAKNQQIFRDLFAPAAHY
jgi:CHAD domain-containing protein